MQLETEMRNSLAATEVERRVSKGQAATSFAFPSGAGHLPSKPTVKCHAWMGNFLFSLLHSKIVVKCYMHRLYRAHAPLS